MARSIAFTQPLNTWSRYLVTFLNIGTHTLVAVRPCRRQLVRPLCCGADFFWVAAEGRSQLFRGGSGLIIGGKNQLWMQTANATLLDH